MIKSIRQLFRFLPTWIVSVPLLFQPEIVDKPPTIELDDLEVTVSSEQNSPTNVGSANDAFATEELTNKSSTKAELTEEPDAENHSADSSVTNEQPDEECTILANQEVSITEESSNIPSTRNPLTSGSSSNEPSSSSSTNEELNIIQGAEARMNANESRRSNEYLQEENLREEESDICIGKADLNLTEGYTVTAYPVAPEHFPYNSQTDPSKRGF